MLGEGRPEELRVVDQYRLKVQEIGKTELLPAADDSAEAGAKIAACCYQVLGESQRPEVAKHLWIDVGTTRGKTAITKLTNYMIDSIPRNRYRNKGIVQEVQNEITSTVNWLSMNWQPLQPPTYEEVLDRISHEADGIYYFHRQWMRYLSGLSEEKREEEARRGDRMKQIEREEVAAARGVSVEELIRLERQEAEERKRKIDEARWADYIKTGTPVQMPGIHLDLSDEDRERIGSCLKLCTSDKDGEALGAFLAVNRILLKYDTSWEKLWDSLTGPAEWMDNGLIYLRDGEVGHGARLMRVSEVNTQRVRDCMVR